MRDAAPSERSISHAEHARLPPAALRGYARSLDLVERAGQQRAHRVGAAEIEPRCSLLIRSTCRSSLAIKLSGKRNATCVVGSLAISEPFSGSRAFDAVVHVVWPGRSDELGVLRQSASRRRERHLVDRLIVVIIIAARHPATIGATCAGAKVRPLRARRPLRSSSSATLRRDSVTAR